MHGGVPGHGKCEGGAAFPSTHSVARTSVAAGNPHLAPTTALRGRHCHVPLRVKMLRLPGVRGLAAARRGLLPLPAQPPGEKVATVLARLLPGLLWESKCGRAMRWVQDGLWRAAAQIQGEDKGGTGQPRK